MLISTFIPGAQTVMKLNPVSSVLPLMLTGMLSVSSGVVASDQGIVNMQGTIVESACVIHTDSQFQSVEMGNISISRLRQGNSNHSKALTIQLINCPTGDKTNKDNTKSSFRAAFEGASSGDLFKTEGEASGVAIQITDEFGKKIIPGQVFQLIPESSGIIKLNYYINLVSDKNPVRAGAHSSSVKFKLDYY